MIIQRLYTPKWGKSKTVLGRDPFVGKHAKGWRFWIPPRYKKS